MNEAVRALAGTLWAVAAILSGMLAIMQMTAPKPGAGWLIPFALGFALASASLWAARSDPSDGHASASAKRKYYRELRRRTDEKVIAGTPPDLAYGQSKSEMGKEAAELRELL